MLLFAAFGSVAAVATPSDWSQVSYPAVSHQQGTQSPNLTNTAQAPPTTSRNLTSTGNTLAQAGDLRALDGVETTGSLYTLLRSSIATKGGSGRFSGIQARNVDEAQFLRNAEATFGESTTWTGVTRHRGELVVQRSDIELSQQNVTRMRNGQAPFVRNANGDWEPLQLHHVGRETGQMIEVTRSQNRYNHSTGGPLHIPGLGGPIRQPNYSQSYWQQRYQGFINSGQLAE
ncbi:hypothetical protein ROS1_18040 [Roseibium sp. ROS1]